MRIDGSMDAFTMPKVQLKEDNVKPESSAEHMTRESEQAAKTQETRKKISEDELFQHVKDANHQLKIFDRRLEFSIHESTHKIMVKVINTNDDSVIREIPSEKALDMLAYVWKMTGILLDEKR